MLKRNIFDGKREKERLVAQNAQSKKILKNSIQIKEMATEDVNKMSENIHRKIELEKRLAAAKELR